MYTEQEIKATERIERIVCITVFAVLGLLSLGLGIWAVDWSVPEGKFPGALCGLVVSALLSLSCGFAALPRN